MIEHILFDFDGTLADSKETALAILNQLAGKYRFKKVEPADIEFLSSLSLAERCRLLNLPLWRIPFLLSEARILYQASILKLRPFNNIRELLADLKTRGFHLTVLSSNSESNIRQFLLNNRIGTISSVCHSSSLFGKAAEIKRFLRAHKLSPSQVIYVGDEQRDIVACHKSGIRVIWVGWGYDSIEAVRLARPDFVANAPEEIISILQSTRRQAGPEAGPLFQI